MRFHELLVVERRELIRRWLDRVRQDVPRSVPLSRPELADHVPQFIDEVALALRLRESPETSATAATHGVVRLKLGFDIGSVVREYGALRDVALELAFERSVPVGRAEAQVLSGCIITGIADSVAEYARQRDADLHRQATQHLAFLAHEVRNPLQSATMAVRLLKHRRELPDGPVPAALERGLARMQELIDHTLELARLGTPIQVTLEPVSMRSILEDVVAATSADSEVRGVVVEVQADDDIRLKADPMLLRSAISNIVRNAVKYTRVGSTVHVRARRTSRDVEVDVDDCCGGIHPDFIDRAFAPFVQEDKGTDGFGLGLAIAKQAVEAHHGSIRVANRIPEGCTFTLSVPVGE